MLAASNKSTIYPKLTKLVRCFYPEFSKDTSNMGKLGKTCKLEKGPCNTTTIHPIKVIKDPLGKNA